MPSLNLSKLFRRSTAAPTLRERAASLRAHISPRVVEPSTIAGSSPTEAPTPIEPAAETDAELLRLGREFKTASARETAANEACNAAQREAERHMPERPACLIYRVSDASLGVHQERMMADALAGREIGWSDIHWLRHRMPMQHEVLRPIRKGERAHIDHPGRKFDIVPHPEAQARAEEIVAAWDAWWTEQTAVCGRYVTEALEAEAEEAGNAVASLAHQIAELPAHTAAGFRVKLRALSHLSRKTLLAEIPDEPDPDQALSHSLWRDVQGKDRDRTAAATVADRAIAPDPIVAAIAASRSAEAEMDAFLSGVDCRRLTDAEQAQEEAIDQRQRDTRAAVWAIEPTTAEGRAALVQYGISQAELTFGPDWRAQVRQEFYGDLLLALLSAIGPDTAKAKTEGEPA